MQSLINACLDKFCSICQKRWASVKLFHVITVLQETHSKHAMVLLTVRLLLTLPRI